MSLTLRLAVSSDAATIASLNRHVQDLHGVARPEIFKVVDTADVVRFFAEAASAADRWIWLAEDGATAVGYLLAIAMTRDENAFCRAQRWLEIDQIAVSPAARRSGVARALVERAIADGQFRGLHDVSAQCWTFNAPANAAFQSFGFASRLTRYERRGVRI